VLTAPKDAAGRDMFNFQGRSVQITLPNPPRFAKSGGGIGRISTRRLALDPSRSAA